MSDRIISISAAPYDGFAFPAMLDSIASCGAQYVEPAFIVGYTEPFGMIIGLENPGNGEDNLFNLAEDGLRLLEQIGSPYVRLNYDAGNTVSHRPGQVDPAKDALVALPGCGHIHLKDVEARNDGYYFVPIGEGDVDCPMILQSIKNRPDLNLAIETPLRFHRNSAAQPCRNNSPVEISVIESVLRKSLEFVRQQLV